MKHISIFFLVISLLVSMVGCSRIPKDELVTFYYPRAAYTYQGEDSVIASEARSKDGHAVWSKLLQYYIQGPEDIDLINPFPADLDIASVQADGTVLKIIVSDHLADLSEIQLILACASLAKTAMGISGATSVRISCVTKLIGDKSYIVIDDSTIIFEDMPPASTESTQQE